MGWGAFHFSMTRGSVACDPLCLDSHERQNIGDWINQLKKIIGHNEFVYLSFCQNRHLSTMSQQASKQPGPGSQRFRLMVQIMAI